jgi:DNA polymerase-4
MADQPRAIVHLDLDAFYAAVEVLENPELVDKPVVVGGRPQGRGVVTSASYPARAFGVRSAMPMARALALCPDAIICTPRHGLYAEYSKKVMAVLRDTSPLVEQMSIDEAFLDFTDRVSLWEKVVDTARQLQQQVQDRIGLSASLGVATNKLVAKVASDQNKPHGLTVVRPGEEAAFLAPLSVRVLWGIGPVTAERLAAMEVTTVGQLAAVPEPELQARFGNQGKAMARQARGIDRRPVRTGHRRRSASQERTFDRDIASAELLERRLESLSEGVARRLQRSKRSAGTIAIKIRYSDFTTLTRQMSLSVPTADKEVIHRAALMLLRQAWQPGRPVRLLGVAGRQLSAPVGQLPLWESNSSQDQKTTDEDR